MADELLALVVLEILVIVAEPDAQRPRTTVAVVDVAELQGLLLLARAILLAALDHFACPAAAKSRQKISCTLVLHM